MSSKSKAESTRNGTRIVKFFSSPFDSTIFTSCFCIRDKQIMCSTITCELKRNGWIRPQDPRGRGRLSVALSPDHILHEI